MLARPNTYLALFVYNNRTIYPSPSSHPASRATLVHVTQPILLLFIVFFYTIQGCECFREVCRRMSRVETKQPWKHMLSEQSPIWNIYCIDISDEIY